MMVIGFLLTLVLATTPRAAAATTPAATTDFDRQARRAVLDALFRQLHARYVFPESVARIEAHLGKRLRSGAYDSTATRQAFSDRVTADLRAHDLHFDLRFDTEREQALLAAGSDTSRVLPELEPTPDSLARLRRDNFGFHKAELLPGNVGHLEITFLHDLKRARSPAEAAIGFVANADAVILDLRHAPGGYGNMVQFLASSFFGADSVELLTTVDRELGTTRRGWSNPAITPYHLAGADLYVLTGPGTGSAAEALAFAFQISRRAVLVGERTAGAAHAGGWVPLRQGFVVFIPNARGFDPKTGRDWEGTGVLPDSAVAAGGALDKAYATAVHRIAGRNTDPRRAAELGWLIPLLDRRAAGPLAVAPALLDRYAGAYERCEIRRNDDGLQFIGASGMPQRLIPLTEDTFLIDDDRFAAPDQIRVRFVADAGAARPSLELLVKDGRVLKRARVGS
jgi:retinol-binding protein 3